MYICPTCGREFREEVLIQKHFLSCWKEKNPYHQSKPAPRSEDIVSRDINDEITDFFNSFK